MAEIDDKKITRIMLLLLRIIALTKTTSIVLRKHPHLSEIMDREELEKLYKLYDNNIDVEESKNEYYDGEIFKLDKLIEDLLYEAYKIYNFTINRIPNESSLLENEDNTSLKNSMTKEFDIYDDMSRKIADTYIDMFNKYLDKF